MQDVILEGSDSKPTNLCYRESIHGENWHRRLKSRRDSRDPAASSSVGLAAIQIANKAGQPRCLTRGPVEAQALMVPGRPT